MFYCCRAKSSICHHYILFFHPQLAFHAAHIAVFFLNRSLFIYWKAEKCQRWHSLAAFNTLNSSLNCCKWVLYACQSYRKTHFPFKNEHCVFHAHRLKRSETWVWKGFPRSSNLVPCYSRQPSHWTFPINMLSSI